MSFGRLLLRDSCESVIPRADASWRAPLRPLGQPLRPLGQPLRPPGWQRPQDSAGLRGRVEVKADCSLGAESQTSHGWAPVPQPWELAGVWTAFSGPTRV